MKLLFATIITMISFLFKGENEDVIEWDAKRLLKWEDFRGKPQRRFAAASTSYDILKLVSGIEGNDVEIEIKAVFYKYKSWKKKSWINESVLEHEQRHFDIVELFARKLRQKLSGIVCKGKSEFIRQADSLYSVNDVEMDAFQNQYDDETDGSMNGTKQKQWNLSVAEELKKQEKYEAKKIKIKLH